MYIVREIFQLKFGHFKPVKALLEEAKQKGFAPQGRNNRILSDFTGNSYRLVMETEFDSLADFEKELTSETSKPDWQEWYKKFMEHAEGSHREILKFVM